jgi:hypothetical protein
VETTCFLTLSLVGNPIVWLKQVCLAVFQIAILLLLFSCIDRKKTKYNVIQCTLSK